MKINVISRANLPTNPPVTWTFAFFFARTVWNVPEWLQSLWVLCLVLGWFAFLFDAYRHKQVKLDNHLFDHFGTNV